MNTPTPPPRIALYARVSSEDQAERQTIQNQTIFLTQYANLMGRTVVETYADDGVSGTIPLNERAAGKRLLADAKAGRFSAVVLYRLDRLGRSLRVLLDAYGELEAAGVALQSATEPFDTGSPIGRFVFQLLGSIAELEKETIVERTSMGRDRVASAGRWVGTPVPYGYVLDGEGQPIPATDPICILEGRPASEADVVRFIFRELCAGGTCGKIADTLNALGVPTYKKWQARGSAPSLRPQATWQYFTIRNIITSTIYAGLHRYRLRNGAYAERRYTPLVTQGEWDRAQAQLTANRSLATRNAQREYLLRGLIRCGNCGAAYVGGALRPRNMQMYYYYRCNHFTTAQEVKPKECIGKMVRADMLESWVWGEVERFIQEPSAAIERARRELAERQQREAPDIAPLLAELDAGLIVNERGRDRLLDLYRRDLIDLPDLERQMTALRAEAALLRERQTLLSAVNQQQQATADYLESLPATLAVLREMLPVANPTEQRRIIELAIDRITITTTGTGWKKTASITAQFKWGGLAVVM